MKNLAAILLLFAVPTGLLAQNLPLIFATTPKAILKAGVLVSFPKNTWLENMIPGDKGALYVTNYPEGKIYRITVDGTESTFAKVDGKIAGIANYKLSGFLVTGWDNAGKPAVFLVNDKGETSKLLNIEGGMFPNGIVHFYGNKYLIADSFVGCIWEYDADANTIKSWLKDSLLERSSPNAQFPAVNGLKMHGNYLYVSVTEKQLLVRIPLTGMVPGKPKIFKEKVNIDDFTFDDAGNIYAATNVYNSVIRITPKGVVSLVAEASEGAVGSTAVLFRRNAAGKRILYVSTNGGMGVPPPGGIEEGKILTLYLK